MITDVRYCMSVAFFKRLCLSVCAVFVALAVVLSLGGKNDGGIAVKTVYYVVQETKSVEASSAQITLRGGAGYAIADGVAFEVYFSEEEAKQTLRGLEREYCGIMVYPLELLFLSAEDAYAYSVLEVVGGWTKVLQNGGAQATVREGLESVVRQLSWRAKKEKSDFLSMLCGELRGCLEENILYVDALRRFTCFGCEELSLKNRIVRI